MPLPPWTSLHYLPYRQSYVPPPSHALLQRVLSQGYNYMSSAKLESLTEVSIHVLFSTQQVPLTEVSLHVVLSTYQVPLQHWGADGGVGAAAGVPLWPQGSQILEGAARARLLLSGCQKQRCWSTLKPAGDHCVSHQPVILHLRGWYLLDKCKTCWKSVNSVSIRPIRTGPVESVCQRARRQLPRPVLIRVWWGSLFMFLKELITYLT